MGFTTSNTPFVFVSSMVFCLQCTQVYELKDNSWQMQDRKCQRLPPQAALACLLRGEKHIGCVIDLEGAIVSSFS